MGRLEGTLHVLVVDDDAEFRAEMAAALRADATVWEAATPDEALRQLDRQPIDVLICDLVLARDASGDDLLEVVRGAWPRVVRILVTGSERRVHLAPHAAHAVLSKPCDLGALRDLLTWVAASAAVPGAAPS